MTNEKNRALGIIKSCEEQFSPKMYSPLGGGSQDIRPLVDRFFETCRRVIDCVNEKDWQVIKNVAAVAQAGLHAGLNTFTEESIQGENYEYMQDIFRELEKLLDDMLINARPLTVKIVDGGKLEHSLSDNYDKTEWSSKIHCISMILYYNQSNARVPHMKNVDRNGMIFQSLKYLSEVVSLVNRDWNNLVDRGFSLVLFEAFKEKVMYEMGHGVVDSEDEKFSDFMAIICGEKKLIPVYKYTKLAYATVDRQASDQALIVQDEKFAEVFCLVD